MSGRSTPVPWARDQRIDQGLDPPVDDGVPLGGLAGAEHDLAQSAVVRLEFAHLLQAGRQPVPRVGIVGRLPGGCLDLVDHRVEDRVDQLFLVGEVPVGGAHAEPRVPGHVVEGRGQAPVAEHLAGRGQQTTPVQLGVAPQRRPAGFSALRHASRHAFRMVSDRPAHRTDARWAPLDQVRPHGPRGTQTEITSPFSATVGPATGDRISVCHFASTGDEDMHAENAAPQGSPGQVDGGAAPSSRPPWSRG